MKIKCSEKHRTSPKEDFLGFFLLGWTNRIPLSTLRRKIPSMNIARMTLKTSIQRSIAIQDWKNCFFWTSAKQSLPLTGKSRFDENKDKKYGHDQSVKKDRKILSLMVWGAKTFSRPRTLIPVNDIVNNQKYSEILSDHLPGLISSFGHEQCIFDCDNFRAHTSRHTYQIVQENIRLTDWPAKSPVINIIENLWKVIKKDVRISHTEIKNKQELFERLSEDWLNIPLA